MKNSKLFWILVLIAAIFGISIYFSSKKLKVSSENVDLKRLPASACTVQTDFKDLKSELGKLVNQQHMYQDKPEEFLKLINDFRARSGLPLPISVSLQKLKDENIVFNNCRSTCKGSVHEVFVLKVDKSDSIEVLKKGGTFSKLKLHESGLELASVDELNKKGVPFRSWLAPISEGDWYVKDNEIFYKLDIEGLWLRIDRGARWDVVSSPRGLTRLTRVEEPLKVPGCNAEEECLEAGLRHFKAPKICHN